MAFFKAKDRVEYIAKVIVQVAIQLTLWEGGVNLSEVDRVESTRTVKTSMKKKRKKKVINLRA